MSSRHKTDDSHSNIPSEMENHDNNNHNEINFESLQGEQSVEPNENPTENRQKTYRKTQNLPILRFFLDKY